MSGLEYQIDVDESGIQDFLENPINEKKINAAIDRALKKTIRWLAVQTARGLAKDLDVLVKSIRDRLFFDFKQSKTQGVSLWVGLNDIHADSIGKLRQNSSGISARGHHFKGAFIAEAYKGKSYITAWRRASSKHSSSIDEVRNNGYERNQLTPKDHKLWPRYPLKKVGVRIEYDGYDYLERQEQMISQRFNTILHQELNYEFYVKS